VEPLTRRCHCLLGRDAWQGKAFCDDVAGEVTRIKNRMRGLLTPGSTPSRSGSWVPS
jgi:hypothetical protein